MLDIDYEKFIRERICNLRAKKKVSARDMSLSIGQSENYINMIENSRSLPSVPLLIYICEYFEISPKEFFDEENDNPKLIKEITTALKNLNDEQLEIILNLINNFDKEK